MNAALEPPSAGAVGILFQITLSLGQRYFQIAPHHLQPRVQQQAAAVIRVPFLETGQLGFGRLMMPRIEIFLDQPQFLIHGQFLPGQDIQIRLHCIPLVQALMGFDQALQDVHLVGCFLVDGFENFQGLDILAVAQIKPPQDIFILGENLNGFLPLVGDSQIFGVCGLNRRVGRGHLPGLFIRIAGDFQQGALFGFIFFILRLTHGHVGQHDGIGRVRVVFQQHLPHGQGPLGVLLVEGLGIDALELPFPRIEHHRQAHRPVGFGKLLIGHLASQVAVAFKQR